MLISVVLLQAVAADIYAFSPEALRKQFEGRYHNGAVKSSLANFGNPPYGTMMLGRVFRPAAGQELACEPLFPIDWVDDPDPDNSPILLVERGTCSFALKVRNAQNIGARAVLIADNKEEDIDHVIMSDNGAGGNLFIPSFLISKSDADLIKSFISDPKYTRFVAFNLHFNLPRTFDTVQYEIWMSSGNSKAISFIQEFASTGKQLKKDFVKFTPRYVMWFCHTCASTDYRSDEPNCLSGGRYCAPDPDNTGPLSGRDVLYEDLREICVFKQTEESKHKYDLWFDYMKELNSTCPRGITEDCSYAAMDLVSVDVKKIKACVAQSFEGSNHALSDNTLLREQRELWSAGSVAFTPAVTINNQTYRGDLESDAVLLAICAGFEYGTQPDICGGKGTGTKTESDKGSKIGAWTVVLIVVLSFGAVTAVLLLYSWWIRREYKDEMRRQLSDAVHQYIALSESSRLSGRN